MDKDKIVLLSGKELACEGLEGNFMKPGLTGMSDGSADFFIDHAFFFFDRADEILSDSKMFLAPVPIVSGLAYIGTKPFESPTLGIYLEWWHEGKVDVTHDNDGCEALTYYIAGSPLSGMNGCSCVYRDGRRGIVRYDRFSPVWHSFVEINKRYEEAKGKYAAYTLEQIFGILDTVSD